MRFMIIKLLTFLMLLSSTVYADDAPPVEAPQKASTHKEET